MAARIGGTLGMAGINTGNAGSLGSGFAKFKEVGHGASVSGRRRRAKRSQMYTTINYLNEKDKCARAKTYMMTRRTGRATRGEGGGIRAEEEVERTTMATASRGGGGEGEEKVEIERRTTVITRGATQQ